MSALRDFWTNVVGTAPSDTYGWRNIDDADAPDREQTPASAPVLQSPAPARPGGKAAGPGAANPKAVSFDVYNPGKAGWAVLAANDPDQEAESSSAGAIRRGTSYADYERWQDSSQTYTYKANKAKLLGLTFEMSSRVAGTPKSDPGFTFYVADVRVKGKKTGLGGIVSAHVEGVRALWEDSIHVQNPDIDLDYRSPGMGAVTFTLVIRIKSGPRDGGDRTVRITFTVSGANRAGVGVWTQHHSRETPGI
jgi:hypothetical protein